MMGLLWWGGPAMAANSPAPVVPATVEFIQNKGQWPTAVRFAAPLVAGQLFLERTGFTYALTTPWPHRPSDTTARRPRQGHAYRVQLVGGLGQGPIGEQPTTGLRNYFCGDDSAHWARDVPSFRAVRYPAAYAGIGLRVYENVRQQLEYTFTVQPGAQPATIALRYEGTEGLALDPAGNLRVATSVGVVTELAPRAWQTDATGRTQPVPCAFALSDNTVRFGLGPYDKSRPLIIDPVVVFATFTGSTADNWGHTATYDAQGNLYSAGTVFAVGYPTTSGAFDPGFNGSIDVAIIKYDPTSTGPGARRYATYLGGRDTDVPHRLTVDAQGELILLGTTGSADFPRQFLAPRRFQGGPAITPEYGVDYPHGADLFVARLSADGRYLVGSTYLGGTGTDGLPFDGWGSPAPSSSLPPLGAAAWRGDVQVDAQGNVYVATATASRDFPGLNSFQTVYRGGPSDAVVCQLSPDLKVLRWSAFVGGRAADAAFGLSLAPNGLVYVAGSSTSADFPVTAGAYQPAASGGADGFVVALSSDGQVLRYACRTGTADADAVEFVQADASSTIYVAGLSTGQFASSPGSLAGGGIFVQQLSADLSRSLFAASLGEAHYFGDLTLTAFRADDCGTLYLAAVGLTAGLPLTEGARPYEATYVARLSAHGRTLDFGACYGGDHTHGISRFGPEGALYQAICGNCRSGGRGTFPIPPQAGYYTTVSGASNCNDASLKIAVAPIANSSSRQLCLGAGPLPLGGSPAGGTWRGPGVAAAPGGGFQFVPSAGLLGNNSLTYTVPGSSFCPNSQLVVKVLAPTTAVIDPIGGPYCATQSSGLDIKLVARPAGGVFSGPGVSNGRFSPAAAGPGSHTITYTFSLNGECGSGELTVRVLGTPLRVGPDTVLCGQPFRPFQLTATPAGGTWSGPGVSATGWFDPAAAFSNVNASTSLMVTAPLYSYNSPDGCLSRQVTRIILIPNAPVFQLPARPRCPLRPDIMGFPPYTFALPTLPPDYQARYYWDFGDGQTSPTYNGFLEATSHTYTTAGAFTPVLHIEYQRGCPRAVALPPLVLGEPQSLPNIITPNADGLNEFFVQRQFCELPELRVFSRWGQQVYHTAHYQNDWNAAGLPSGTYYYRFLGEQARTAKGWLEVRR